MEQDCQTISFKQCRQIFKTSRPYVWQQNFRSLGENFSNPMTRRIFLNRFTWLSEIEVTFWNVSTMYFSQHFNRMFLVSLKIHSSLIYIILLSAGSPCLSFRLTIYILLLLKKLYFQNVWREIFIKSAVIQLLNVNSSFVFDDCYNSLYVLPQIFQKFPWISMMIFWVAGVFKKGKVFINFPDYW